MSYDQAVEQAEALSSVMDEIYSVIGNEDEYTVEIDCPDGEWFYGGEKICC